MEPSGKTYVSNRVLKINVGFLLSDGPAHSHQSSFDVPRLRVADDLDLTYLRGPLRLSRTTEGILVQGQFEVGIETECYRCLDPVTMNVTLQIEELYAHLSPKAAEFVVHDDAILDLGPLIRAEVLIITARGTLCCPDCKGLCPECGANWNYSTCTCSSNALDPRWAGLKGLLK